MSPVIVDIEASGFGRGSYPIEVGLALADGTPHCFLVAPVRTWTHWDPQAEQIHGISRDCLEKYGRPVQDVAWRLNELLRDRTVYSDAWLFDMSWLGKLYDKANLPQRFRIAPLVDLMSQAQMAAWDETKVEVTRELASHRHRASGDARILQETFRRTSGA